ncbi:hypothetical protein MBANPS3_001473 [Mucor bainieri]
MVGTLHMNDLKNYPHGSTHRQAKAILHGVVAVVRSETHPTCYPRGTVLLQEKKQQEYDDNDNDNGNHNAIPCLVNRLYKLAIDIKVYIKRWNYVNLHEGAECHLEFRFEDLYEDEACKKSVLRAAREYDIFPLKQSLRLEQKYYIPGGRQPPPPLPRQQQKVHMAGIVYAVSTLYAMPNKPAMFLVQLTDSSITAADTGTELSAVNVLFSGDELIDYYRHFDIGGAFAFHNLLPEVVHTTERHAFHVLQFDPIASNVQAISHTTYRDICSNFTLKSSSSIGTSTSVSLHQQPLTLIPVHKHTRYKGTITRVIDSIFGIYELDHKIIVSLFHMLSYSSDMPYRVDAQVRLHHFHAVMVSPEDGETSHLLQHVWQVHSSSSSSNSEGGYFALAGCMQSHVEVLLFPKNHNVFQEIAQPFFLARNTDLGSQIKHNVYTDIVRRKSTFPQLLRQLEIYAALTAKFVDTQLVFAATQTPLMRAGDMINDFVLHDAVCVMVGEGNFRAVIDAYPSLDNIQAKLEAQLQDYNLDLAGGNTMFEKEHVVTQKADYDQRADFNILGLLQVARDGRLYLIDNESRVLIVLAAPHAGSSHTTSSELSAKAGTICMVRRLHLLSEDLAFVDDQDQELIQRNELRLTYFVCQESDLLVLLPLPDNNRGVVFCLPDLEHGPLTRKLNTLSVADTAAADTAANLPVEHPYLALRVVNRFPVEACFSADGRIHLACRITVTLYPIHGLGPPSERSGIATDSTKHHVLELTSLKHSLQWHLDMQVGTYWVLYGLDADDVVVSVPTFTLDADRHTLYPLLPSPYSDDWVSLTPHYYKQQRQQQQQQQQQVTRDPSSVVYKVSQVANSLELPRGVMTTTTKQHFCEQLLHVQGVVIIKRFMEAFPSYGPLNKHATRLHNQLGISTGKPNRKLFVQLRQPDILQVINIYMDVHKTHYPVGMVVGATVTFRNLLRKKKLASQDDFFFMANAATCIHVNSVIPSPSVVAMEPALVRTRLISSFLDTTIGRQLESDRQIFRLFCYIHAIINLTLKWECRDCGSIVRNNDCYGMCQGASRVFSVHAFVLVSDGTGNATAGIDGERLVFRLLQLSANQVDALKHLVLDYGQLTYGGWGGGKLTTMDDEEERMTYDPEKHQRSAMHGYTLEDLCNNAKRAGQFYLYGQEQTSGKKRAATSREAEKKKEEEEKEQEQDLIKEFHLRKFKLSDNGSLLKTAELSKLRVKVIEITFPDARMATYDMLDELNQSDNIPPQNASSASVPTYTSIEVEDFDYTQQQSNE